jgi:hypothetical protein
VRRRTRFDNSQDDDFVVVFEEGVEEPVGCVDGVFWGERLRDGEEEERERGREERWKW